MDEEHVPGTNHHGPILLLRQYANMSQLYLCIAVATSASCINGYNNSVMGGINSYKQYREYFGFDPEKGTPYNGIAFAIDAIGGMVGSLFVGPLNDFKGTALPISLLYKLLSFQVLNEFQDGNGDCILVPCSSPLLR
jgi:Sugar (and other) transporter